MHDVCGAGVEREGRAVGVAAHAQAAVDVSVVAGIGRGGGDDALLQEYEALRGLESRAGGISAAQCAVKQRHGRVSGQHLVVLSARTAHHEPGVVARCRHQAQYLARMRLYGHHCTALAHHERLGVLLQAHVDTEGEVAAGYGRYVVCTPLVAALDASAGVAYEYLGALDASQVWLVGALDAQVAGVVARGVVVVGIDVVGVDLAQVAQHVGRRDIVVLAQDALLYEEAREAVQFLLQAAVVLARQLRDEALGGIGGIARIEVLVAHIGKALAQIVGCDVERAAEVERVERLHIARYEHHVIGRLIVHHQLALAVIHQSARGVHRLFQEGVAVGRALVPLVVELQVKQPADIYQRDKHDKPADDILAFLEFIVFSHGVYPGKLWRRR